MTQQYLRKCSIAIGNNAGAGIDVSDLRCTFSIRRGDYQNPNSADIRVYNPANNTANRIANEFTQVTVQAGYEVNFGLIFRGTIKQVRKGREDAKTSYVDITAADGDTAYNFAWSSFTLAANTTPKDSALAIIKTLQDAVIAAAQAPLLGPNILPTLSENGSVRGKVLYGMARDKMRAFCETQGLSWSIQDGQLVLIPLTSYLPGEVPVISPTSGLVGVPEQTRNGIEFRTLLNPKIKIGQLVKLDSTAINRLRFGLDVASVSPQLALAKQVQTNPDGAYYVMVANHQGDTRGQAWWTDVTCLSTNAEITGNAIPTPALPENVVPRWP